MSKKILALMLCLLACLSLLAGCAQSDGKTVGTVKDAGKLVVATSPDFPPFENLENGEIVGSVSSGGKAWKLTTVNGKLQKEEVANV